METKILGYIDGRLKASEQREMEKHLAGCPTCTVRVNEFRMVGDLLGELPMIEPSDAFDVRLAARIAAEPVKQPWWSWLGAAPRVLVAASMLLLATVWIGNRQDAITNESPTEAQVIQDQDQDLPVLENYDILANFEPLTELPQALPAADDSSEQDM
jgi:anti-sigma factor RsiW